MGAPRRARGGGINGTRAERYASWDRAERCRSRSRFAALLHAKSEGSDSLIYEVFRQERKGQPLQHAGSISAPDDSFAHWYAREQYGRRGESAALWVVPREAVHEISEFVDELERNYHRVDGYPLKEKLKAARERAGTTVAG